MNLIVKRNNMAPSESEKNVPRYMVALSTIS